MWKLGREDEVICSKLERCSKNREMKWYAPNHTASKEQSQKSDISGLPPESIQWTAAPYAFKYWFYEYFAISDMDVFVIYISSLSSPLDLGPHVILPDFSS